MKSKTVFLIYGEGGHQAQMRRLVKLIGQSDINFVHIVDSDINTNDKIYKTFPIRKKKNNKIIFSLFSMLYNLIFAFYLFCKYRPKVVLSTGPAICFPFFVVSKLFRSKSVFLETWSRFYSKSFTAKIVYPIADHFYYQNINLSSFYPKGEYSGRL